MTEWSRRLAAVLAILSAVAVAPLLAAEVAVAGECDGSTEGAGSAGTDVWNGSVHVDLTCQRDPAVPVDSGGNPIAVRWVWTEACAAGGAMTCSGDVAFCSDGSVRMAGILLGENGVVYGTADSCPRPGSPSGPGLNEIRNAFDQVLLPDSVLEMQPPNGETLINFRTNFLTNAEPFDASLKLAGHDLDFRIRATHFTWHFGDGEKRTTSKPGDRYPHLVITHEYLHKGQVTPSVDTTWTADYRLDGGEWLPVPETVTKVGAPQDLLVRTATPHLVQY